MRVHRLFEIVYLLIHRKRMTANELAEHFEVSRRTILRDIEILSAAGIPVVTTRGKGGGVSILPQFVLNRGLLSEAEQNQILLALQELSAAGPVEAGRLLGKLEGLFQQAGTDWIEVDFSRWGLGETDNRRFALLKGAVLNQRAVTFDYVGSSGEKSARTVYPLKLIFKSKAWYLQGFCTDKQNYRTFKLGRMLDLQETILAFSRAAFDPPPIEVAGPPPDSLVALELAFPPQVAYRLYDEFDEQAITTGNDGWFHVYATLPEDGWLYGFLLSFGSDIRVLRPEHVREKLLRRRGIR